MKVFLNNTLTKVVDSVRIWAAETVMEHFVELDQVGARQRSVLDISKYKNQSINHGRCVGCAAKKRIHAPNQTKRTSLYQIGRYRYYPWIKNITTEPKGNRVSWYVLHKTVHNNPAWRIWDVYPGSRILIFTHPGSRIQNQQQKRGVKKNLLS